MLKYYVVSMIEVDGYYKVHSLNCNDRPNYPDYLDLGYYKNVSEAVEKAKKFYSNICICENCCASVKKLLYQIA